MDLRRKGNQCPLGSGSSNAHSTAAARNSRYSLYMWRTRACATKCTQLALRTRHASLQAAPSITVPLSSATSHPCFSSKPSAPEPSVFHVKRLAPAVRHYEPKPQAHASAPTTKVAIFSVINFSRNNCSTGKARCLG